MNNSLATEEFFREENVSTNRIEPLFARMNPGMIVIAQL